MQERRLGNIYKPAPIQERGRLHSVRQYRKVATPETSYFHLAIGDQKHETSYFHCSVGTRFLVCCRLGRTLGPAAIRCCWGGTPLLLNSRLRAGGWIWTGGWVWAGGWYCDRSRS